MTRRYDWPREGEIVIGILHGIRPVHLGHLTENARPDDDARDDDTPGVRSLMRFLLGPKKQTPVSS
jgi:hypothetical protein